MTDKKWWVLHLSRVAKSDYSPCADADDVERILAEHTRRIVKAMEGLRQEIKPLGSYQRGCAFHDTLTEHCECFGWNLALDDVIEKLKEL